jgi:membrane associated rhomboid family serine protease
MFPIHDDNSDRTSYPVVTVALIVINVLVFVLLQGAGNNEKFTYAWSAVPKEIVTGEDVVTQPEIKEVPSDGRMVRVEFPGLQPTPFIYLTLLTSMFMHGSIGHIFGNMWFLWVFGDNIENDLGKLWYTLFYLAVGILAGLAHIASVVLFASGPDDPGMFTPCLGASGAISGVMGAYLVLHPMRRVTVFVFRFLMDVPGYVAVGLWFGMQVVLSFADMGGGVAYAAHIGGFIAGVLLVAPVRMLRRPASADYGKLPPGKYHDEGDWRY